MTVMLLTSFVLAFFAGGLTENCLTYALRKRLFHGGTILVRRSQFADHLIPEDKRHGLLYRLAKMVPHVLWASPSGRVQQYTVKEAWRTVWLSRGVFFAWAALWFYDGYEVYGDDVFGEWWKPSDNWLRWDITGNLEQAE